jgi:BMFP domain-containing protein YqiC
MAERPRFFDDLAGVAGGAFSALAGMREEVEATIRARVDEAIRRLDLVKREDLEAVQEMAALARAGQEAAELRLAALEAKVEAMSAATAIAMPAPETPAAVDGAEAAPPSATPAMTDLGTPMAPPAVE